MRRYRQKKVWIKCVAPVVPWFPLQYKSDESNKHYLTKILIAINWRYWHAGKNSRMHMKIQGRLVQARFIKIHQFYTKTMPFYGFTFTLVSSSSLPVPPTRRLNSVWLQFLANCVGNIAKYQDNWAQPQNHHHQPTDVIDVTLGAPCYFFRRR